MPIDTNPIEPHFITTAGHDKKSPTATEIMAAGTPATMAATLSQLRQTDSITLHQMDYPDKSISYHQLGSEHCQSIPAPFCLGHSATLS